MKTIVLAAGFAKRLWPLTKDLPKPLLEVGGRSVLDHLLDLALRAVEALHQNEGVTLVSNARFRGHFDAWRAARPDAEKLHVFDDGALDIADARGALVDLALAFDHAGPSTEGYLVLAGDNLIDFELTPHLRAHEAAAVPATLLVRRVTGVVPPARHGEVLVDCPFETSLDAAARASGHAPWRRVTRFREKPEQPESDLVATGIYMVSPDAPSRLAAFLARGDRPSNSHDAPGHFFVELANSGVVGATLIEGRFFDIGNREALEAARAAYM